MDVEIEQPHVHHRSVGHRWFDFALPIAALFVSFVSIYIAWHHSQALKELVHQNERLVEANSLPYLQISGSNDKGTLRFNAVNECVGPARIVTAEVLVNGTPVPSLEQLVARCCGTAGYEGISSSSLQGRMVRPGDTVTYISLPQTPDNMPQASLLDRARQADRIVTRLCYCSVFDDCWLADSRDPTPSAVNHCPPVRLPYRD